MGRMKRSVGYCTYNECEDLFKGIFLLNHHNSFYCPRCRHLGIIIPERGWKENDFSEFKSVKLEYNYAPETGRYRELVVITDNSVWGERNVFRIQSPLIRTEKRATRVATVVLANLMHEPDWSEGDDCIPRTTEIIMSFDKPIEEFRYDLAGLKNRLEHSTLIKP